MTKRRPPISKKQPLAMTADERALAERYSAAVHPLKMAYQEAEKSGVSCPEFPAITPEILLVDLDYEILLMTRAMKRNPRLEMTSFFPLQLRRSKRLRAWIAAGGSPSRQELSRRFTSLARFSGGDDQDFPEQD